jgi:hypothetical protein
MSELEELLADLDPDKAEAIKQKLAKAEANERALAEKERDLKLATGTFKKDYPRAWRAYEKGKLNLKDALTDEAIVAALRDKEDELAELGVPLSVETEPVSAPPATSPVEEAFGEPVNAGGPPKGRNYVSEYMDAMNGSTIHDQAKANKILVELNKLRRKDDIEEITRRLEARPITPSMI